MKKIDVQLSAGNISRYHTLQITGEQNVGSHTYGVCQIMRYITDEHWSKSLMRACLDHDVVEFFTGDIPFPTKRSYPELNVVLKAVERSIAKNTGLDHNLSVDENNILHVADLLEMGFFGADQLNAGNSNGRHIIANVLEALATLPLKGHSRVRELTEELEESLYERK